MARPILPHDTKQGLVRRVLYRNRAIRILGQPQPVERDGSNERLLRPLAPWRGDGKQEHGAIRPTTCFHGDAFWTVLLVDGA